AEGIFANGQAVYLKDLQTGTVTNLSEESYSFTAQKGLTEGRFEIVYQPQTILAAGGSTKDHVTVYRSGSEFVVKSPGMKVSHLEVYDTSGKLMMRLHPDQTEIRINAESWVNGMYVLKMERGGTLTTKKVMK
ncbi:T9SS type A sorting domain-containing protein, partial [Kaistella sp.]|uniref:T9SS type A sorting domain-containing protein n=1 Tax=Kaistella sp. TaxID=2782235 RepID=UPI002F93BC41